MKESPQNKEEKYSGEFEQTFWINLGYDMVCMRTVQWTLTQDVPNGKPTNALLNEKRPLDTFSSVAGCKKVMKGEAVEIPDMSVLVSK